MIPQSKVDEILNAARIEEVIGEFVNLKKAGASLRGLSPWTSERTPSFYVTPSKGIFKDFSSGKGGSVVTFLMEHEHFTYPEALRWLAKRYNIEVEPEQEDAAAMEQRNERESLYVINEFARQWFSDVLWQNEDGRAIGLSYFKERDFHESIIRKFQLGYSPDQFQAFTAASRERGYKQEYLMATGLVKQKDGSTYDGYRGRVIFPIHNLSGRVIGFGGRTQRTDKHVPKYINTPENLIYNKSQTLYGIYFAKGAISREDNCYLVEGYTDVISFHQKHIENTVASSGTALTEDQVRLIARYTRNITLVFDGDRAGIKASLRGIDIILEQGMNVRVVLLPEGHDPDSFSHTHLREEVKEFLKVNAKDFIAFKAALLMEEAEGDPIKTNEVIHAMVDSIALIPDIILRSLYITECSRLMRVSEQALVGELNKNLRKRARQRNRAAGLPEEVAEVPMPEATTPSQKPVEDDSLDDLEKDILRLMLTYYDHSFTAEGEEWNVLEWLIEELQGDGLTFENKTYNLLLNEIVGMQKQGAIVPQRLLQHPEPNISQAYVAIVTEKYVLNDWQKKDVTVLTEDKKLFRAVTGAIYAFKAKKVENLIRQNQELMRLQMAIGGDPEPFLKKQVQLDQLKVAINAFSGTVVRP